MKNYFKFIDILQESLLGVSIAILMILPILISYYPELLVPGYQTFLFGVSFAAVTFVMAIRPLADLLGGYTKWIRPLVILRKGLGVLSASIVVSVILSKIMIHGPYEHFLLYLEPSYWSLNRYALFAHLGDLTAIPLLITSNNFSKKLLGANWKRLQKLAYVYFYSGALYEFFALNSYYAFTAIIVVTTLVMFAFIKNLNKQQ